MSQKFRICYRNHWRDGTIIARSSEHPQFPAENTQDDDKALHWRSRYGAGSGNGLFAVIPGVYVGPNLVTNGAFEYDLIGWYWNDCTLARVGGGESGNCLEITRVGDSIQYAYWQLSGLTVGSYYFAQCYVKSGTSGNEAGSLQFYDGTDFYIKNFTSSGTWTIYTIVFKATTTTGNLYLVKNSATAGTMLFDTVIMGLYSGGNQYIDFDEGGVELEGIITDGAYNGNTLATAIAAAMNAAPGKALTYTCTYSESNWKFTIAAGSNFKLRLKTGSKMGCDFSNLCGFVDTADLSGAATYTAPFVRIHTYEYIEMDLGSAKDYDFIALLNHNLSINTYAIYIQGADDSAFTTNLVSDTISYNANDVYFSLAATRTKRYIRIFVLDETNSSGYVKIGTPVVGKYIEFTPYIKAGGHGKGEENPSLIDLSDSQNLYVDDKPRLFKRSYPFEGLSNTDASNILLMQEECADHKGIIVCIDPDNPNTASEWVTLAELNEVAYEHVNYWNWTMNVREHK